MQNSFFTHKPTDSSLIEIIRQKLPEFLSEKRLCHTLSVEKEAISIANSVFMAYNIPSEYENDLRAAALLHDITKEKSNDEQLLLCEKYNIELNSPISFPVLHGKTAAHFAKELFGINEIVFSAIFNHTTGCEDMNVFEKIIFLADYIEPTRKAESCRRVRDFFYETLKKSGYKSAPDILNKALELSLKETLNYLNQSNAIIDNQTVKAYNFIIKEATTPTQHLTKE